MVARFFYLEVKSEGSELNVRRRIEEALQSVFGLTGAAIQVDLLRAEGSQVLLRVPADQYRRVRAAITLSETATVLRAAPSLFAFI